MMNFNDNCDCGFEKPTSCMQDKCKCNCKFEFELKIEDVSDEMTREEMAKKLGVKSKKSKKEEKVEKPVEAEVEESEEVEEEE